MCGVDHGVVGILLFVRTIPVVWRYGVVVFAAHGDHPCRELDCAGLGWALLSTWPRSGPSTLQPKKRAIGQALGLSQTKLADRLGMTQPMVSRIERGGRQPTVQQGAAITLLAELMKKENGQGKNSHPCP